LLNAIDYVANLNKLCPVLNAWLSQLIVNGS